MAVDTSGPVPGADFFFKGETGRNTRGLLRLIILCTIAAAAISARLFSVIRFESIIHECQFSPKMQCDLFDFNRDTNSSNSRSVVQFPSNKIPRQQWLLQLLGLVR
jgi:dolichyl-diphosphooligosaccharide--protein glycosyltransferase